jgi:GntR family transcriptional regulator/MocR family aminotransferase
MDLFVAIDRTLEQSLRDQLYAGLRGAILDGRLAHGARLPATRALAKSHAISRFTVDDAYSRLIADGYATGRHGSGTYVAYAASERTPASDQPAPESIISADRDWSNWGDRLTALKSQPAPASPTYSFKQGVPALDHVPLAVWRRCQSKVGRSAASGLFGYGPPSGFEPLRRSISGYLARSRMLRCDPEQIVITSGTQEAIDLIARLFVDPGDAVVIEEPSYPAARRSFAAAGAELLLIPVDAEGLRVELLGRRESRATLIYVTPSHQFPTGGLLPLNRRRELIEWARETGTLIVEDDYDSEFRYGQRPIEALAALDPTIPGPRSVIYIGTFSKVLFPALRLGYIVLPPDLIDRVTAAKETAGRHAPTGEQATLAEFIDAGHFERHLARMRRMYAARSTAMLAAIDRWFGNRAQRHPAATTAGLHTLFRFELPYGEMDMVSRAAEAGILIEPASPCYAAPPAFTEALLGYGAMNEEQLVQGVQALARALLS